MKHFIKRSLLSKVFLLVSLVSILGLSLSVFAVTPDSNEKTLSYDSVEVLPDGGKIYVYTINGVKNSFPVPPEGFNPVTASDEELKQYAFPPRPAASDSDSLKSWTENMSDYKYTPVPDVSLGDTSRTNAGTSDKTRTITLNEWSGYMVTGKFSQVQGDFVQPTIHSSCIENTSEGTWVGLGGRNTGKLIQTGTSMDTYMGRRNYYAWYEFLAPDYKNPAVVLKSVTVNGGDKIHLYCAFEESNNRLNCYIANSTNGTSQSIVVDVSASTYFDSSTAEWINEWPLTRFDDDPKKPSIGLTRYTTTPWTNCQATNDSTWHNISSLNYEDILMYEGSHRLADVANLSGGSFTSRWQDYN